MFHRILVPVDGSTFSEDAIPCATKIAAASDAKLEFVLVHVPRQPAIAEIGVVDALDEWDREHRRTETDYLNKLAGRVAAATGRAIDPIMLSGDIVSALEHEIRERGVDLVVMTTHGRAGLARAWLGSVADALIRSIDPPVLLIRPEDGEPVDAASTAPRFGHVLIALDGTERAEHALAARHGARPHGFSPRHAASRRFPTPRHELAIPSACNSAHADRAATARE